MERLRSCTDVLIVRARPSCVARCSSLPKLRSNGLLIAWPEGALFKSTDRLPERFRGPDELDHVEE